MFKTQRVIEKTTSKVPMISEDPMIAHEDKVDVKSADQTDRQTVDTTTTNLLPTQFAHQCTKQLYATKDNIQIKRKEM